MGGLVVLNQACSVGNSPAESAFAKASVGQAPRSQGGRVSPASTIWHDLPRLAFERQLSVETGKFEAHTLPAQVGMDWHLLIIKGLRRRIFPEKGMERGSSKLEAG